MKTALITTTITTPHVLAEYRALDESVDIIVAGDVTGPVDDIAAFCDSIDARFLSYEEQESLGYQCSAVIGPRSIQRRVIAILEALKTDCEVLISIDTDNFPTDDHYFEDLRKIFSADIYPTVSGPEGWVNPGYMSVPPHVSRGMPLPHRTANPEVGPSIIDVVQSLVFGDPDTSALDRIAFSPHVEGFGLVGGYGFIINPRDTWSVINSQSTAWRRPYACLAAPWPGCGRFDDIVAGWVCQRILAEDRRAVFYGPPLVQQSRHEHNLVDDLEQELWGMRYGERFCRDLKEIDLSNAETPPAKFRVIAEAVQHFPYMSAQAKAFALAYAEDLNQVEWRVLPR